MVLCLNLKPKAKRNHSISLYSKWSSLETVSQWSFSCPPSCPLPGLSWPPDCAISFPHFQKQHNLHPILTMTVLENDSDLADWSDVNALSNPSPEAPLGCICSWKAEPYALWVRKYFEIHVKSWKRETWVLEPTNSSGCNMASPWFCLLSPLSLLGIPTLLYQNR